MKNIMVDNVSYDGSHDQECICVFTDKMNLEQLKNKLDANPRILYDDIYEVPNDDLQFYVYNPIWDDAI